MSSETKIWIISGYPKPSGKLRRLMPSWRYGLKNFQLISLIQKIAIFIFSYRLSEWVEILQGFTKFNFKLNLEKQKVLFLKKKLNRCQYQNEKALFTDSIFPKVLGTIAKKQITDVILKTAFLLHHDTSFSRI